MSIPYLLIDGYNLLHAAGLARSRYAPGDLERLRARLIGELVGALSIEAARRCTVVFDAREAPPDLDRRQLVHGITVQFAEPGTDADSLIERLLRKHPTAHQVLMVSSDHRLQTAARRRGARFTDSEPFWESLRHGGSFADEVTNHSNRRPTTPAAPKRPTHDPQSTANPINNKGIDSSPSVPRDVAYWLAEFGDINTAELSTIASPPPATPTSTPTTNPPVTPSSATSHTLSTAVPTPAHPLPPGKGTPAATRWAKIDAELQLEDAAESAAQGMLDPSALADLQSLLTDPTRREEWLDGRNTRRKPSNS